MNRLGRSIGLFFVGIVCTLCLFSITHIRAIRVYAADCTATFKESGREITACIGGFSSPEEIKPVSAEFKCTQNSNLADLNVGVCRGINTVTQSLSSAQIGTDSNGKYYSCATLTGINRAIGKMVVSFNKQASTICTANSVLTKPSDWNAINEGIPFKNDETNRPGEVCAYANNNASCVSCFQSGGSWTAIGCIPTSPAGFIVKFLSLGIGLAGGVAFLLILFGGFQMMTSAGNPEQINAGKELIGSAIAGLILIIFSLFILRFIGYNVLGIPGFG
jgi:hypothetical protein